MAAMYRNPIRGGICAKSDSQPWFEKQSLKEQRTAYKVHDLMSL